MGSIPWAGIIELLRFALWIALAVTVINLFKVIASECLGRFCRHCGKKV